MCNIPVTFHCTKPCFFFFTFYLTRTSSAVKITKTTTTLCARPCSFWTVSVAAPRGASAYWAFTSMRRMWPSLTKPWRVWLSTVRAPAMKTRYKNTIGEKLQMYYFVPFKALLLVSCRIVSPPMNPMELTLLSPWFLTTSTHLGRSEWTWCWSWRWVEDKAPPLCEAEETATLRLWIWPRQSNSFLSRRHSTYLV